MDAAGLPVGIGAVDPVFGGGVPPEPAVFYFDIVEFGIVAEFDDALHELLGVYLVQPIAILKRIRIGAGRFARSAD